MHEQLCYHSDLNILQKGCEPSRSYYIPFSSREEALENNRVKSEYFKLLNGEWDFCFFESISDIMEFPSSFEDTITVPSCWQNTLKYDKPVYLNVNYPFPVDPPFLPKENPCGLYRKEFDVSRETLEQKEVYLNFEGVCSCFYLWVNEKFCAYSQGSHMSAEVNITSFLKAGKNEIRVLVVKFCIGSYLEDQDMFRLSGIFRDVYLLYRDKIHIKDIDISYSFSPGFSSVEVKLILHGAESFQKNISVYSDKGETIVYSTLSSESEISFALMNPRFWSAEDPYLYTFVIECGKEVISQRIGFWDTQIKDGVLFFNGEKIKITGVNHHDSNPFTGYYLSEEDIRKDIFIMKRHNVNAVRTSHYPPSPMFLEMCDEFGIYVIDEADIETHGFLVSHGNMSFLSEQPEWAHAFVDRAARLYERDKNHPCVLMWSLGNESGFGENHRRMAEYLRYRDTGKNGKRRRLIHYEGDNPFFNKNRREADVGSAMYSGYSQLDEILDGQQYLKPFFLCEYSHAMGNSCGDINEYVDKFYTDDRFLGGCVWEFSDHAVAEKDENGNVRFLYGGDFGEKQHDGNFCVDGLVSPLREPKSSFLAVKQAYRPFDIIQEENKFLLKNRKLFMPLDITLCWILKNNGQEMGKGKEKLFVAPKESVYFDLPVRSFAGETVLSISVIDNKSAPWAKEGHEIGKSEFILSRCILKEEAEETHEKAKRFRFEENNRYMRITANKTVFIFDCDSGSLRCIRTGKADIVSSPFELNAARASIDNDRNIFTKWESWGLFDASQQCRECTYEKNENNIIIKASLSLGGPGKKPFMTVGVVYKFLPTGSVRIKYSAKIASFVEWLPRFGVSFTMPGKYEKIRFYGYGPEETYIDKNKYAFLGVYEKKTDTRPDYLKPQQSGDIFGVRWAEILDKKGHGLKIASKTPFSFRASKFSEKQLMCKKHCEELEEEEETFVSLDYKMSGTGSASCGPELQEKFRLCEKEFDFSFDVYVI